MSYNSRQQMRGPNEKGVVAAALGLGCFVIIGYILLIVGIVGGATWAILTLLQHFGVI